MKTIITPQQALEQIKSGHLSQLKGLDAHDFTHIFDGANKVLLLTYYLNGQDTPAAIIKEKESEIHRYAENAKGAMLQLVCGKNHDLLMDEMNVINTVNDLFPESTGFAWDVEHSESTDFKLRIDLYVVIE